MPLKLFTLYTVVAIIPWSILFIYLGEKLGGNWRQIKEYASDYTHYIIIGAVLFYCSILWFKVFQKEKSSALKSMIFHWLFLVCFGSKEKELSIMCNNKA